MESRFSPPKPRLGTWAGLGALTLVGLSACTNLAPAHERPALPLAATIPAPGQTTPAATTAPTVSPVAALAWQDFVQDAPLRQLIDTALANNRDLRVTALNIEKARAQYQIQRADLFPTLKATGSGTGQRTPAALSGTGAAVTTHQYSVGLGFSAFELDFFGRVQNLRDQALYQFLASEEAQRSARLSLIAEVTNAYLTLAADGEHATLAARTLESQQQSFDLIRKRLDLGSATELDLRQAEISLETARADLARYQLLIDTDRNALQLLVGSPLPPASPAPAPLRAVNQTLHLAGPLPAEVLLSRPDVRQAERSLQASEANIGAARAAFFPTISLTASTGLASTALNQLFKSGAGTWSFIPQVSLPLFDAGRLDANLAAARVDREIAVAQYEKTVQTAFREVADALAQKARQGEQLAAQEALTRAAERAYELARVRYEKGVDSYLAVLDAQRTHYSAQQNLLTLRLSALGTEISLYKALGGGEGESPVTTTP